MTEAPEEVLYIGYNRQAGEFTVGTTNGFYAVNKTDYKTTFVKCKKKNKKRNDLSSITFHSYYSQQPKTTHSINQLFNLNLLSKS